jgi:hypothetical protein
MRRVGFTTVELIMIVVVIGIMSIFVMISAINPYRAVKVDAAAKKVAADLQCARNLAISTAKWYGISFELDPLNTYRVYVTDGITDEVIEDPARLGKNYIVNLHDYYDGVKILAVNIESGSKLEFHPLGIPYNDRGGSEISLTGMISLEFSGRTRTIQIIPDTGRVRIP